MLEFRFIAQLFKECKNEEIDLLFSNKKTSSSPITQCLPNQLGQQTGR